MKKLILFLLLCAVLGAGVLWAKAQISDARNLALQADREAALADTARLVALSRIDSIQNVWELRSVQWDLKEDSLDRELERESALRIAAELRVDTLRIVDTVAVPVLDSEGQRTYHFGGVDGPFHFEGTSLLLPSFAQTFSVVVTTDPLDVFARVQCAGEGPIRSAHLLLEAPDPFQLVPRSVEQEPDVCNAKAFAPSLFSFNTNRLWWALGGFALGVLASNWLDDGFRKASY